MTDINPKLICLLLAGLFLFQAFLFWPVTMEFFTPDGIFYLARQLGDWTDLKNVFTSLDDVANYRPLTYLVATKLYSWWQLDPFPYHLFTLIAHTGITALVFWLARLLLGSDFAALASAVFFGVHSSAVRVTFGITFISDLLYAAFFIFSIIAFVKYEKGLGAWWLRVSLLSFALGLLSKEPAVTLPAVITVMMILLLGCSWRHALKDTLPFWILGVGYLAWFAVLTSGRFVPQNPSHPYYVSLSWDDIRSKAQYLEWAVNLRRFATMAAHPTITAVAARILPAGSAELFAKMSDFWLYLMGPIWIGWLAIKGNWQALREIWVYALMTPLLVVCGIAVAFRRTALFGLLFFAFVLSPVMILPASKTMLHNLYVPIVGIALIVGQYVQARRLSRFAVAVLLMAAGVYFAAWNFEVSWPTTTSRAANMYLDDMHRLHPDLPKGAVLYFEPTGMPDWPFLTAAGDLFRVFYGDRTLVTMFGDYGEKAPQNAFRFREMNGTLLPIQ